MADPIGAVSLAIDLCDRLLDYYKKYKGYNEDISSTYSEISGLRQSCELLEKTLQDVSLAKDQVCRLGFPTPKREHINRSEGFAPQS